MKYTQKFTALILALVIIIAMFSGCGNKDENALHVGVKANVSGFGLQDARTKEYSGFEIELAEKIASELGYESVKFTTVTQDTRGTLLDEGKIDCVIATFTITPERQEKWDFSSPYYTDTVGVLVNKSSGITTLDGLIGKKIGVATSSTTALEIVRALQNKGLIVSSDLSGFSAETWTDGVTFAEYHEYSDLSKALQAGDIDAFSVDKSILRIYLNDSRQYIEDTFAFQDYGVATQKDSALSKQIENLISKWLDDGTIAAMIDKWNLG